MAEKEKFSNIFIDTISNLQSGDSLRYFQLFFAAPEKLRSLFFDPETSSFVKGLLRSYDIDATLAQKVTFAILNTLLGEQPITKLSETLSANLQLAPAQAQKMASEIEKDIFGPIKGELDAFLSRKIAPQSRDTAAPTLRLAPLSSTKPNNLLDLKEIAAAKRQEQLNAQPPQKQLPKRQVTARIAPPRAPLPPPLTPPQAGGGTTAPKFPLPPRTQLPSPPAPPRAGGENAAATPAPKFPLPAKPAVSPIDFSKY